MKGEFEYIGTDYKVHLVYDTDDIPTDAKEMVRWWTPPVPGPHTQEDHDEIAKVMVEFQRVKDMIYGRGK